MIGVLRVEDSLGRRLVVILKSFLCGWGRCVFCPFWMDQSASVREVIETNRRVVAEAVKAAEEGGYGRVAVFNGSSFNELPLDTVVRLTPLAEGRVFEVEERSEYVDEALIKSLLRLYRPKELVVRVGFEVWDEGIREGYLRKGMPQSEVFRLAELRKSLQREGLPVRFLIYVLFGIEGVPEDAVVESVRRFKELFDGVVAVRYRRFVKNHPREVRVSERLAKFLEREADLVDWGEGSD